MKLYLLGIFCFFAIVASIIYSNGFQSKFVLIDEDKVEIESHNHSLGIVFVNDKIRIIDGSEMCLVPIQQMNEVYLKAGFNITKK